MALGLDPFLSTVSVYYFPTFFKFIIVYIFNPRINKVIIIINVLTQTNEAFNKKMKSLYVIENLIFYLVAKCFTQNHKV